MILQSNINEKISNDYNVFKDIFRPNIKEINLCNKEI